MSDDPAESVSAVNRVFAEGLAERYQFLNTRSNRRHGTTRQSRFNPWNLYYVLKHAAAWVSKLIRHRPAIVHFAVSSGWAMEKSELFLGIAKLLGARTVGHLHSGGFIDHWENLGRIRRWGARRMFEQLDTVVVLSEGWRCLLSERVGVPEQKIEVVYNPIDPEFEEAFLALPSRRPDNVFLSLGIMGRDKGVLDLVHAVARVQQNTTTDFLVRLAGPEREPGIRKDVREQIQSRSLEEFVSIQPSVWGEEKAKLFRAASIFVLPSYYENFPLVLLEAAAAGHAIITTPVGATPEFFVDGISALFVEPGNIEQLSTAMRRLLDNPSERDRLAIAGREVFVQQLSRDGIMGSLDDVYQRLLNLPPTQNV